MLLQPLLPLPSKKKTENMVVVVVFGGRGGSEVYCLFALFSFLRDICVNGVCGMCAMIAIIWIGFVSIYIWL